MVWLINLPSPSPHSLKVWLFNFTILHTSFLSVTVLIGEATLVIGWVRNGVRGTVRGSGRCLSVAPL